MKSSEEIYDEDEARSKEAIFSYLDFVRDSGVVNMFGAAPYLMRDFKMDKQTATTFLKEYLNRKA